MNRAQLIFTINGASYGIEALTYKIDDPREQSLQLGGQIIKEGFQKKIIISITAEMKISLFNFFTKCFQKTWNSNAIGSLWVRSYIPGIGVDDCIEERFFQKAVVAKKNLIETLEMGQDVIASIEFSVSQEKGVKYDLFSQVYES